MPKLYEELNATIVLYMIFFAFAIHQMDRIDVIVACMICREAMYLHEPWY